MRQSSTQQLASTKHSRILRASILQQIETHAMIRPGDRLGLAVSGGADSVAMLRLFAMLQPELAIRCTVLHFNHQLRGAESGEDERFVAALAQQMGFPYVADRADVAGESLRHGWNLEDGARRLRYQFLHAAAAAHGLDRVAVAHTADDQAETVLAHILRGTGPAGLAGIYPVAGLVIRPLLAARRSALRDYVADLGQSWREDATNQDTARTRARLRRHVLPIVQEYFGPAAVTGLGRLAGLAREDEQFWRALEDECFRKLAAPESGGRISIGIADLLSPLPGMLPVTGGAASPALAVTRRLVRRMCSAVRDGSRQNLSYAHIRAVLDLAAGSSSGSCIALPGVSVQREFGRLVFSAVSKSKRRCSEGPAPPGRAASDPCAFEYAIPYVGRSEIARIAVPEIGRCFGLKIVDWPPVSSETVTERAILDADRISWPLILRNWRPGDSYRPNQRRSVRKLKRLLLEARVPRSERSGWPVLTSAGALVWTRRFPVAHQAAPQLETRSGLLIFEESL